MAYLSWFKFTPSDWIMGKIQRTPEITQARFMRLICLYWNKHCELTIEDAEIEIDKDHLELLLSKKIIKIKDDFVVIEFLDEQLETISETSQKRKEAVLQRWAKVKQNDTSVSKNDTNVLQSDTDKIRIDKKRKEDIINNNTALPFKFFDSLVSLGIKKELVSDWLKVRKTKKLTNTETSFNNLKIEFEKSGRDFNDIINKCVTESWGGFKASWAWDNNLNNNKNGKPKIVDTEEFKQITTAIRDTGIRR